MKKNERQLLKTNGSAESDEYRKLVILIVIIAFVFIALYIFTTIFTTKDKDNIFKNDLNPSEIQYSEIIIGNMFDKGGHYYVLLLEEDEQYKDLFKTYINELKEEKRIYTVDLASAFNKKYISDYSDYDEDDFKVSGTTLVEIKDHKIKSHYETKEGILEKFRSLKD